MRGIFHSVLNLVLISEKTSSSQKICGENEGSGETDTLLNIAKSTGKDTGFSEIEIFGELEEDCAIIQESDCINLAYRFKKLSVSGDLEKCSRFLQMCIKWVEIDISSY